MDDVQVRITWKLILLHTHTQIYVCLFIYLDVVKISECGLTLTISDDVRSDVL